MVDRQTTVDEAEHLMQRMIDRYTKLCLRWNVTSSVTDQQAKEYLFNKLPNATAYKAVKSEWETIPYDVLVWTCKRIHHGQERSAEIQNNTPFVGAIKAALSPVKRARSLKNENETHYER